MQRNMKVKDENNWDLSNGNKIRIKRQYYEFIEQHKSLIYKHLHDIDFR